MMYRLLYSAMGEDCGGSDTQKVFEEVTQKQIWSEEKDTDKIRISDLDAACLRRWHYSGFESVHSRFDSFCS